MAAWCDGIEETRILIAPVPPSPRSATGNNGEGLLLSLRHPKSGDKTCYYLINGSLQELHWFKQSYGSWFLGDYVCEDGRLYIATPIDPVFLFLPIYEEARMKKDDDQGKFRQLDEILFLDDYPGYKHLLSIAEECMQVVCEMKVEQIKELKRYCRKRVLTCQQYRGEIGSTKFFRLNDSKVLAWLCHKVHQLKLTLPTLDKNYAVQDERDRVSDAVSLLGEYLKEEPWLKLLCNHLKLDLQHATRQASVKEIHPSALESTPGSSNYQQAKGANQKKTASNSKQTKKMKIETNSQDIKDMFRRASSRRAQ